MKNIILALALTASATLCAQTNELLTWQQCLDRAQAQSPELIAARAAVRELEFGVASASAGFLPQITASAGAGKGQTEFQNSWSDWDSASADISLQQDLFSAGGNIAGRRRALAQLDVGHEQYRKILADVELRTRLAYLDVLYAQDLIELTQKIEERRADNVRLIQLRFDGGRENAGSLARSKAQLSQAQFERREAQRSLDFALRNLAAAMGQVDVEAGVDGELQAERPDALIDLSGLTRQTPDYNIATTQIEATKQGMKVVRSARFPTVSLNASAGVGTDNYDVYDGSWDVSLRASMPIYTGNRLKSEVAAAKEIVVQSEMELLNTVNTLMATLQQRWNFYMDAVENEAVQKELLDAEILRAEISTAKYKQGLLSYEDWDLIESNLINQGKTHLQRRRTAEAEQARWKNALGRSDWFTKLGE